MAEYIERKAVANAFQELLSSPYADVHSGPFNAGVRDALKLARDMVLDNVPNGLKIPPADVVPVVRCRDCKHFEERHVGKVTYFVCENVGHHSDTDFFELPDGDWFCADGEIRRKEGAKNEKESDL